MTDEKMSIDEKTLADGRTPSDKGLTPVATIISIVGGVTILWKHLAPLSPYLLPSVICGILLYILCIYSKKQIEI